jgi:hypothetical protein
VRGWHHVDLCTVSGGCSSTTSENSYEVGTEFLNTVWVKIMLLRVKYALHSEGP